MDTAMGVGDSVLSTLNPKLLLSPKTLNPKPYPLNLNHKPQDPKPQTLFDDGTGRGGEARQNRSRRFTVGFRDLGV